MKTISIQRQSGFTLVEIAIVLVIIGVLLGGVLKGTELIENSKVKRMANDINGVATAYNAYIDRYRAIPGDDGPLATLNARGGAWASVTLEGTVNRVLATGNTANALGNPTAEGQAFWQHLRASGYLSGDPAAAGVAALPINAFGGVMGVTVANVQNNLSGLKLCSSQVSGKAAISLDNQLDDGDGGTGNLRATASTGTNPTNAEFTADYDETATYIICVRLQ